MEMEVRVHSRGRCPMVSVGVGFDIWNVGLHVEARVLTSDIGVAM
jgi:hypothetical protein